MSLELSCPSLLTQSRTFAVHWVVLHYPFIGLLSLACQGFPLVVLSCP